MSKQSVSFAELFDFSRSTIATYIDPSTDNLASAAIDEARFSSLGLVIERAATNLLLNSETPATQTVTVANGLSYTLASYGVGAGYAFVSSGGSGTAPIGTPITFTASGTSVEISVSGSLERFQLEIGSDASGFVSTAGTTATRAADLLSRTFGSEYNEDAGTFFVEFAHAHQSIYGNNHILSSGTSRAFVRSTETGEYEVYNGLISRDYPSVSPSGSTEKLAISIKADEWIISRNGSSATYATTSDPLLDVTLVKFLEVADGVLSKFEYWPYSKTAAELEALTA